MANLALIASTAVKLLHPEAVVVGRGRGYIKHRIADAPDGRQRFVLDTQVGGIGWHYGPALDQEVDTAWEPGVAPWNYQMVKAEFNARALSRLNAGQVIEYRDPNSDQYVRFQPMALQYSNALNQISQISMPQAVDAQVNDDTLTWVDGYGPNRTLVWQCQTARLHKELHLAAGSLPAVPQFIRDGGSPVLELNFIFAYSSGVTPWINGTPWTGGQQDRDTQGLVEFKDAAGNVLWWFNLPRSWDSAGVEQLGIFRFRRAGTSLYVSHRIPLSWIEDPARVWPVKVDTTVDVQVGASTDDVRRDYGGSPYYSLTDAYSPAGVYNSPNTDHSSGHRFLNVTVPNAVTVTVAHLTFTASLASESGACTLGIGIEDADDAVTFGTEANFTGRPWSAYVSYSPPTWTQNTEYNTPSLVTPVQGVVDRAGWASGQAMAFKFDDNGTPFTGYLRRHAYSYNGSTTKAAKLHIEYTAGGGGGIHIYPNPMDGLGGFFRGLN